MCHSAGPYFYSFSLKSPSALGSFLIISLIIHPSTVTFVVLKLQLIGCWTSWTDHLFFFFSFVHFLVFLFTFCNFYRNLFSNSFTDFILDILFVVSQSSFCCFFLFIATYFRNIVSFLIPLRVLIIIL